MRGPPNKRTLEVFRSIVTTIALVWGTVVVALVVSIFTSDQMKIKHRCTSSPSTRYDGGDGEDRHFQSCPVCGRPCALIETLMVHMSCMAQVSATQRDQVRSRWGSFKGHRQHAGRRNHQHA
jgi:hypothetical protein